MTKDLIGYNKRIVDNANQFYHQRRFRVRMCVLGAVSAIILKQCYYIMKM